MSFPGDIHGGWGDEKVTGTAKMNPLGTRLVLPDGRAFRYGSAGEAITAGKLCMQAIGVALHDMDLVTTAAAVGASSITVTLGNTAATKDQYADGYIYVNSTAGPGHIYRIASNPAADASGSLTVALEQGDEVAVALTSSSETGLMVNPYSSVELWDVNDIDGPPVGVSATNIASGSYGWFQTWGYAAVWTGASVPTLGSSVMPADTSGDDGQVEVRDEATVTPNVGVGALIAAVDGDYGVIKLTIAP